MVFNVPPSPRAPEYSVGAVSIFFENSWRYWRMNVYHRCQRHRRYNLVTDFQWSPMSLIPAITVHQWQPVRVYTLRYRGLSCTRTCLDNRNQCWSGHVFATGAWAAPGHIYTTEACECAALHHKVLLICTWIKCLGNRSLCRSWVC